MIKKRKGKSKKRRPLVNNINPKMINQSIKIRVELHVFFNYLRITWKVFKII